LTRDAGASMGPFATPHNIIVSQSIKTKSHVAQEVGQKCLGPQCSANFSHLLTQPPTSPSPGGGGSPTLKVNLVQALRLILKLGSLAHCVTDSCFSSTKLTCRSIGGNTCCLEEQRWMPRMPWSAVLRQLLELGLCLRDTGDVLRRRVPAGTAV